MKLTKKQFKTFINEIAELLENRLPSYDCPYNDNENEWFDENDYFCKKDFCDVTFTTSYEGEVDSDCSNHRGQCYIHYILEKMGIDYNPTLFNLEYK